MMVIIWSSYVFTLLLCSEYAFGTKDTSMLSFYRYLKSQEEPDLLIYNRMPKCGSTDHKADESSKIDEDDGSGKV